MIKTRIFLLAGLLLSVNIQAQMYWLNNFNLAKQIANSSGRLIVADFWATWCAPCKVMDEELWKHPEIQKIAVNFVGVRVNVELEKSLVAQYKVKNIPRLVIISSTGDIIWQKDGYDDAESFLAVLREIPVDAGEINRKFQALAKDRKDIQSNYAVGIELQRRGREIKNTDLKNSFLSSSGTFLAKARQLSSDATLTEEIDLYSILNDVYAGKTQNALDKIALLDSVPLNEDLAELRHYVLAMCYKNTDKRDNFELEKAMVRRKEYLDQIDK